MTLYLTTEPNDADILELLKGIATPSDIRYGDFAFVGLWTDRVEVNVCGDRKKVGDLITCVNDGRHVQQVQDARAAGYDFVFLVVEGLMRPSPTSGALQHRSGSGWRDHPANIDYSRIEAYMTEMELYAGVTVKRTASPNETAFYIRHLYKQFARPPEDHTSLQLFHKDKGPAVDFLSSRPTLLRRWAKELSGVGWDRSAAIADHFNSITAMYEADQKEWQKISGVGKKTAETVHNEIHAL